MSRLLPDDIAIVALGSGGISIGQRLRAALTGAQFPGPLKYPGDWDETYDRAPEHIAALSEAGRPGYRDMRQRHPDPLGGAIAHRKTRGTADCRRRRGWLGHVSWPDELLIRGSLADIRDKVKKAGITRIALVLVGYALGDTSAPESRSYAVDRHHLMRPSRRPKRASI